MLAELVALKNLESKRAFDESEEEKPAIKSLIRWLLLSEISSTVSS